MISVSPDDFAPSPELAQALRRDARDGRPIYELVVPRRPIVDDLAAVPMDATFVATRGTARHLERIATLDPLQALWANPASAELFRVCAQAPALRALYVRHFKRLKEAALVGASQLEHLMLSWAPQLVDLSFLQDLRALRTIYLEDMRRVDLTTLPRVAAALPAQLLRAGGSRTSGGGAAERSERHTHAGLRAVARWPTGIRPVPVCALRRDTGNDDRQTGVATMPRMRCSQIPAPGRTLGDCSRRRLDEYNAQCWLTNVAADKESS
jgi:hypothetical protein